MRIFNKKYPDKLIDPKTGEEYNTIAIAREIRQEFAAFDEILADSYLSVYLCIHRSVSSVRRKLRKYYFNPVFIPILGIAYNYYKLTGERRFKLKDIKPLMCGYSREWWRVNSMKLENSGFFAYPSEKTYEITDDLIRCFKLMETVYPNTLSMHLSKVQEGFIDD